MPALSRRFVSLVTAATLSVAAAACSSDKPAPTGPPNQNPDTTGTGTRGSTTTGPTLGAMGLGSVSSRFTAEVWVRGNTAYTTTWGNRGGRVGNAVLIWDVSGDTPTLVDSVLVANAGTLGDVQVSDDGKLLVVAIEPSGNGGLAVYSVENNPRKPQLLARTTGGQLADGVHTAEIARVNGTLYAFAAVDPANNRAARLVVVSLANPSAPVEAKTITIGLPFMHDVFVRDGMLFTADWADGVGIWDIGAQSGTPENPRLISRVRTVGGQVHNMWWFHDPTNGGKRYLFVGQEGSGSVGSFSSGDIHVVDLTNINAPVEVATYTIPGAGTHNFSMDETNGFLYAAYYNGGVRVLDARGDLGSCEPVQKFNDGRCNLALMGREKAKFTGTGNPVYIWGVHYVDGAVYASDMLNGVWKLQSSAR